MAKLSDGQQITTFNDQKIVLTASNGQIFTMEVSDLANAVKKVIPTFGYFEYLPVTGNRWKRILKMDFSSIGEIFASFLYSGGSYTNSESCCIIINIMIGAVNEVYANRISGNGIKSDVKVAYKWENRILQIWIQGSYTAGGASLINLSSVNLRFENTVETPPIGAINVTIE